MQTQRRNLLLLLVIVLIIILAVVDDVEAFQVTPPAAAAAGAGAATTTSSSTRIEYANGVSGAPVVVESEKRVQERMKRLVVTTTNTKATNKRRITRRRPKHVTEINSWEEYDALLLASADDDDGSHHEELTLVRFFAPWCRTCKATAPLFDGLHRLAPRVRYVEMQVTTAEADERGVPAVPYCHVISSSSSSGTKAKKEVIQSLPLIPSNIAFLKNFLRTQTQQQQSKMMN